MSDQQHRDQKQNQHLGDAQHHHHLGRWAQPDVRDRADDEHQQPDHQPHRRLDADVLIEEVATDQSPCGGVRADKQEVHRDVQPPQVVTDLLAERDARVGVKAARARDPAGELADRDRQEDCREERDQQRERRREPRVQDDHAKAEHDAGARRHLRDGLKHHLLQPDRALQLRFSGPGEVRFGSDCSVGFHARLLRCGRLGCRR